MKNKVKVIDAIMGSGKTYDAIQKMKSHKGSFIYVTPFLNEVDRIISNVPNVKQPTITYDYIENDQEYDVVYKRDNLIRMAGNNENLATTHSLFKKLHRPDYTHFVDYDLILDEVIMPIEVINMVKDDIDLAFNQGLIVKNPKTNEVTYTGDEYKGKLYAHLKKLCDTSNVVHVNDRLLVWAFPPEIFKSFKSITVLTYLFEGSLLKSYFDFYNIGYEINKPFIKDDELIKGKIISLLNIYEGKKNDIGNFPTAFSVNWLDDRSKDQCKKISISVSNLVKKNFKTSTSYNCYTTFKAFKTKLKGSGYTKGFIPVNERATNKYSDKETMLYLANRFLNPNIKNYFKNKDVIVNEDVWALSELLQWVWRGSIRKGKPMNLYVPSKRMRNLLYNWLNEKEMVVKQAA